jgi:hypothetical protein
MGAKGVKECPVKVGDKVCLFWKAEYTVTGVYPYEGKYTQWFNWTVRVALPNSRSGYLEYCI